MSTQTTGIAFLVTIAAAACATVGTGPGDVVSGTVVDCESRAPIAGASVTARQTGWQWQPQLMWDKTYEVNAISDVAGRFTLRPSLSKPVNLIVVKEGFVEAQEARILGSDTEVRLLRGDARSFGKPPGYIVYSADCVVQ